MRAPLVLVRRRHGCDGWQAGGRQAEEEGTETIIKESVTNLRAGGLRVEADSGPGGRGAVVAAVAAAGAGAAEGDMAGIRPQRRGARAWKRLDSHEAGCARGVKPRGAAICRWERVSGAVAAGKADAGGVSKSKTREGFDRLENSRGSRAWKHDDDGRGLSLRPEEADYEQRLIRERRLLLLRTDD